MALDKYITNKAPQAGGLSKYLTTSSTPQPITTPQANPLDGFSAIVSKNPLSLGRSILTDAVKNTINTYTQTAPDFVSAVQEGANTMSKGGVLNTLKGAGQSALGTASTAVNAIFAPISGAVSSVLTNTGAQGLIDKVGNYFGNKISDNKTVQDFASNNPNAEKYISQGLNVGLGVMGGSEPITAGGLKDATGAVLNAPKLALDASAQLADSIYNSIKITPSNKPSNIDSVILNYYNKGVKPSVSGKNSYTQSHIYNNRTLQALDTIYENKPNLSLTNADGITETKLPQTIQEFEQSITQTKKSVFEQYNNMAKSSGEAGIQVQLEPVAAELDRIARDPKVRVFSPNTASYADKLASGLRQQAMFDPVDIQDSIKLLNDKLSAFYRNPSPEAATNASIDALMVNKLREVLDGAIGQYSGTGYQALKHQYGALSAIEKDVTHRALMDARKNTKGLLDFADIASGAQVVSSLLKGNFGGVITGSAMKAIQSYYKYLNDPNTSISKMFSAIERAKSGQANAVSQTGKIRLPQSQVKSSLPKVTPVQDFVNNPTVGLSTRNIVKSIDAPTKAELVKAIDYLRLGKKFPNAEYTVSALARKYGISEDIGSTKLANKFQDLIEKTKTTDTLPATPK